MIFRRDTFCILLSVSWCPRIRCARTDDDSNTQQRVFAIRATRPKSIDKRVAKDAARVAVGKDCVRRFETSSTWFHGRRNHSQVWSFHFQKPFCRGPLPISKKEKEMITRGVKKEIKRKKRRSIQWKWGHSFFFYSFYPPPPLDLNTSEAAQI